MINCAYPINGCLTSHINQVKMLQSQQASIAYQTFSYQIMNQVINSFSPPKKQLTWDELYKIAFPNDPIQAISQKAIKKIKDKYAWLDEYS